MINHDGFIERIDGEIAHVKIQTESSCTACHAKGVCGAADQEEKYLDIRIGNADFSTGEKVKVIVARHLGYRAVALGYVYPFLVLLAVLIILLILGIDELNAIPLALASLLLYYVVLYLSRKRIGRIFTFSIQKI
jgi:sigma-E factor negative regulatory protein RseC